MTELGDRFREFAALCDSHPKFIAAGIIARPNETIVATFVETEERAIENVARGLYYAAIEPPDPTMFREVDEPDALSLGAQLARSAGIVLMDAMSIFVARKLTERIEAKQKEMLRPLINGSATDFPDYKKRAGYLEALGHVLEWVEQIDAEEDDQGRGRLPAHHRLVTIHVEDPREVIWDAVRDDLALVEPFNQQVMVATYIRPATRTASGLEIAEEAIDEDRYQGKVGLVLKKGPRAFIDDGPVKFYGQDVAPGDWVVYRASDGLKGMIGNREVRFIPDVYIKAKIDHPDAVF